MTSVDIHDEKVLILDFGSQYTQLIARRVRELKVYCEIHPCTESLEKIREFAPRGIILSDPGLSRRFLPANEDGSTTDVSIQSPLNREGWHLSP